MNLQMPLTLKLCKGRARCQKGAKLSISSRCGNLCEVEKRQDYKLKRKQLREMFNAKIAESILISFIWKLHLAALAASKMKLKVFSRYLFFSQTCAWSLKSNCWQFLGFAMILLFFFLLSLAEENKPKADSKAQKITVLFFLHISLNFTQTMGTLISFLFSRVRACDYNSAEKMPFQYLMQSRSTHCSNRV